MKKKPKTTTTLLYLGGEMPGEVFLRNQLKGLPRVGSLLTYWSLRGPKSVSRRRLQAMLKERQ